MKNVPLWLQKIAAFEQNWVLFFCWTRNLKGRETFEFQEAKLRMQWTNKILDGRIRIVFQNK
jgi:hypothetical protein